MKVNSKFLYIHYGYLINFEKKELSEYLTIPGPMIEYISQPFYS